MKRSILLCLLLALGSAAASAQSLPELNSKLGEQIVSIDKASGFFHVKLEATLFKPEGAGPFPLVIINHGKSHGDPKFQKRARYIQASRALVRRGFAVLIPMRQGFANSEGSFISGGCDMASHGEAQAKDVLAAIRYAQSLPFIDATKMVVFGQSHGGLTVLALGSAEVPGLLGIVNFAGGYRKTSCIGWEGQLVDASAQFGRSARYPSLWFYGDNDTYFQPWLWKKMFETYRQGAGAKAQLVSFGEFESDSHSMFSKASGLPIWLPEVEKFFQSLGLKFSEVARTSQASDMSHHADVPDAVRDVE